VAQPPCIYSRFRARVLVRCYVRVVAYYEWKQVWLSLLVCAIIRARVLICGSASLYVQSFSCRCAHPLLRSFCCVLWMETSAAQPPCMCCRFRARVLIRCYVHVVACYEWKQMWLSLFDILSFPCPWFESCKVSYRWLSPKYVVCQNIFSINVYFISKYLSQRYVLSRNILFTSTYLVSRNMFYLKNIYFKIHYIEQFALSENQFYFKICFISNYLF
jgi:hypothetical protein